MPACVQIYARRGNSTRSALVGQAAEAAARFALRWHCAHAPATSWGSPGAHYALASNIRIITLDLEIR
jgi:hypothetical protein